MKHRQTEISIPVLVLLGATRGMLGSGLALLLGNRVKEDTRKGIGWTLFLVGALSTIPLAFEVLGGRVQRTSEKESEPERLAA